MWQNEKNTCSKIRVEVKIRFRSNTFIFLDKITGTEYRDCGKHNEVVFSSGEVLAYGNEKTEYENNEIGE